MSFSRKFAPYIGYAYTGAFGQTAAFDVKPGIQPVRSGSDVGFGCGTDATALLSASTESGLGVSRSTSLRLGGDLPQSQIQPAFAQADDRGFA